MDIQFDQNGGQPTQTDNLNPHRRVSQMAASVASDQSHSPISRTGTPSGHHDPNIAPQHLFDGVTNLSDPHYNGIPTDPALHLSQPSPGTHNGPSTGGHMSYDELVALNTSLRTRVSELEVINMVYHDNEQGLCRARDQAIKERDEMKRRVEELERRLGSGAYANNNDEHVAKKPRLSQEPQD